MYLNNKGVLSRATLVFLLKSRENAFVLMRSSVGIFSTLVCRGTREKLRVSGTLSLCFNFYGCQRTNLFSIPLDFGIYILYNIKLEIHYFLYINHNGGSHVG